jgi:hypothetical protein
MDVAPQHPGQTGFPSQHPAVVPHRHEQTGASLPLPAPATVAAHQHRGQTGFSMPSPAMATTLQHRQQPGVSLLRPGPSFQPFPLTPPGAPGARVSPPPISIDPSLDPRLVQRNTQRPPFNLHIPSPSQGPQQRPLPNLANAARSTDKSGGAKSDASDEDDEEGSQSSKSGSGSKEDESSSEEESEQVPFSCSQKMF